LYFLTNDERIRRVIGSVANDSGIRKHHDHGASFRSSATPSAARIAMDDAIEGDCDGFSELP
jgi:hypothetical protein